MNAIIFRKNKGDWSPSGGKRSFLGRQKFLADGAAGGPEIWQDAKFLSSWYPPWRIFNLNKKQKSYDTLKVNCEFGKNRVAPPFEVNAPNCRTFTCKKNLQKNKMIFTRFHLTTKLFLSQIDFWPLPPPKKKRSLFWGGGGVIFSIFFFHFYYLFIILIYGGDFLGLTT